MLVNRDDIRFAYEDGRYVVYANEFIEIDEETYKFKPDYSIECFELIEEDTVSGVTITPKGEIIANEFIEGEIVA